MTKAHLKLGSLFDGIGGFPLVASWYGIESVWASEIEPAPIRITKRHFPNMKHLGDITQIHGDTIEPVDILTGGSPCQDLSVARNQAGIKQKCVVCGTTVEFSERNTCPNCGAELGFTRSGLFMEQIRIIQEMREKTAVRILTPLECERLQGFPDNWTEGESDLARYKALENSLALPCVDYAMSGIADLLDS